MTMIWFCHQPTSVYKHPAYLLQSDGRKNAGGEPEKTYLHVGALCLQELADDLAQLVSVRELSHGGQLRPSGVLGGRARVRGVHLVQTAAERGHLVRALQRTVGKARQTKLSLAGETGLTPVLLTFSLVNELPLMNHSAPFPRLHHTSGHSLNAPNNPNNNSWPRLSNHCLLGTGLMHLTHSRDK